MCFGFRIWGTSTLTYIDCTYKERVITVRCARCVSYNTGRVQYVS